MARIFRDFFQVYVICILSSELINLGHCHNKNIKQSISIKRTSKKHRSHNDRDAYQSSFERIYDIQQDENTGRNNKNIREYRSNTKKELQWNELSSPESNSNNNNNNNNDLRGSLDYLTNNEEDVLNAVHRPSYGSKATSIGGRTPSSVPGAISRIPSSVNTHQQQLTPVVSTRYGQVQGSYRPVPGSSGSKVALYLGVPYAMPPVNANRLSPTRSATQWRGVLSATKTPPACPQKPPKQYKKLFQHQSEDCLYLNIYVPGKLTH